MKHATRTPLTPERVLERAMRLVDDGGLAALSMRRLGQALGVEAMTLYHHVGRKEQLLAALVDRAYAEIEVPEADGPWRPAIRRCAMSAHAVFLRHPWAAGIVAGSGALGPGQVRYMEGLLATLRRGGFSAELTHHAYHALDSHIVGFALWAAGYDAIGDELPDLAERALRTLSEEDAPSLAEHIRYHLETDGTDGPSEFEFGLDLLLDGMEGLLARS